MIWNLRLLPEPACRDCWGRVFWFRSTHSGHRIRLVLRPFGELVPGPVPGLDGLLNWCLTGGFRLMPPCLLLFGIAVLWMICIREMPIF